MTTASIIVVSWNGRRRLESLLPVLRELHERLDLEVVVVVNGSRDGSRALLSREPWVTRIELPRNVGFAAGVNRGAEAARGDVLLLLNDDAHPVGNWVEELCAPISSGEAGIVGGRILDQTGETVQFLEGILTFDGHAFQRGSGMPVSAIPESAEAKPSLFACGGNMAVSRDLFLELGGFDDDYFAYFEDVDLGWRASLAGHRVLLVAGGTVHHEGAATSGRLDPFDRGFLFEVNAFKTVVKNMDETMLRDYLPIILLTLLSRLHELTSRLSDRDGILKHRLFGKRGYRPSKRSFWSRLLGGREVLQVEHPHAISYCRSIEQILSGLDDLLKKRMSVQVRRKVSDRELFERIQVAVVPTYPGDAELFSSAFFRYLQPTGLSHLTLEEIERTSVYR